MKISETKTSKKADQIILVVGNKLTFFTKEKGNWTKQIETECEYGKNGFSKDRHSGDNTTPIGIFPLLYAFGTEKNVNTKMEYRQITENSYFSDDDENLKEYNTWIESSIPIKGEHLIDYRKEYQYAIVIGFNINPKIKGRGSSIFLHCKGEKNYTSGCIAINKESMIYLLEKIKKGAIIVIVPDEESIENLIKGSK